MLNIQLALREYTHGKTARYIYQNGAISFTDKNGRNIELTEYEKKNNLFGYDKFYLKITECPNCKRKMIDADYNALYSAFPFWEKMNFEAQRLRKGFAIRSNQSFDDDKMCGSHYWCIDCKDKIEFKCFNCKEMRLKKDMEYRYGDPPDFLCKFCYETVSAKDWNELIKAIEDNHRWEYD